MALIGRAEERNILNDCLQSKESRLVILTPA